MRLWIYWNYTFLVLQTMLKTLDLFSGSIGENIEGFKKRHIMNGLVFLKLSHVEQSEEMIDGRGCCSNADM